MTVKEIVKCFYEKIISQNRIEEVSQYVSHDCCVKNGFQSIYIGVEGMQEHIRLTKLTSFTGVNIDKVVDGKIVEHCGAVNTFETLLEANLITAKQSFNLSTQNT